MKIIKNIPQVAPCIIIDAHDDDINIIYYMFLVLGNSCVVFSFLCVKKDQVLFLFWFENFRYYYLK